MPSESSSGSGQLSGSINIILAFRFQGALVRARLVFGGSKRVTRGPSAKPSGSLSARACKCKSFWTSVSPNEVQGSKFIVKVSGAQKSNLGVLGGLGSRGNRISLNTQF